MSRNQTHFLQGRPPTHVTHRSDKISRFVRAVYPPGGVYGPHFHDSYILVVVIEGSLRLEIADHVRKVSAGEATLTRPGLTATYRFAVDQRTVHTACQVMPAALSRPERKLLNELSGVFPVSAGVHALIELALAVPQAGDLFQAAAQHIGRACLLHYAGDGEAHRRAPQPLHPAVIRALDLLRSEAASITSAAQLASRSGLSASRLRQLFRAAGFASPSEALWRARTDHAIRLLQQTDLTLAEIAAQSGFADPFHLSRVVKKATRYSPRDLRRRRGVPVRSDRS
ncbi:MAG: helix-turn-helix domain-containing protein [Candidatus Methylacidiphilales bacterium]|nr:helix-turn-helix domain-containing protein [Candidatus Methylacidiphilales bacterium]